MHGKKILTFNTLTRQMGQTLVETLVAIFILVMGIVASLGLAVYSLNASTNVTKQIVAIGLAREGVEAVKSMRDTNWLKDSLTTNGCYDFVTSQNNSANCYLDWLGQSGSSGNGNDKGFDLDPGGSSSGRSYTLSLDFNSNHKLWDLVQQNNNFGLNLNTNFSNPSFAGVYTPQTSQPHGNSEYYRQITLIKDTSAPFDRANLERLQVKSQVWWVDRKCPRVSSWANAKVSCRVEISSYFTNWKDY